jgi:hypothetical protein
MSWGSSNGCRKQRHLDSLFYLVYFCIYNIQNIQSLFCKICFSMIFFSIWDQCNYMVINGFQKLGMYKDFNWICMLFSEQHYPEGISTSPSLNLLSTAEIPIGKPGKQTCIYTSLHHVLDVAIFQFFKRSTYIMKGEVRVTQIY